MTPVELARIWDALQQTWGARFGDTYGPTPNAAWAAALQAIPAEAAGDAYRALVAEGSPHPPTLPEFVSRAKQWRPASATLPAPKRAGPPPSIDELRQAASAEVAGYRTYNDYRAARNAAAKRGVPPAHPTPGSPDWEYLHRLALIEAAQANSRVGVDHG